jgi:hypothetical protein
MLSSPLKRLGDWDSRLEMNDDLAGWAGLIRKWLSAAAPSFSRQLPPP